MERRSYWDVMQTSNARAEIVKEKRRFYALHHGDA
jgi:hypothetical protein